MRFTRLVFVVLTLACLAGVAGARPRPAAAALSSTPDEGVWVTNGSVNAIAVAADGTTYIGGCFTAVGPHTGSGVALSPTSGARDTWFPFVDGGVVEATVPDGAGSSWPGR